MSIIAISPKQYSQLKPDSLLGYLEFHSIPELRIHKSEFATLWHKHGLSGEFLPGEIRACDAYRRATATARRTVFVNWQGNQYTARLMVREVKSDVKEIVRLLVREVVDTRNEVLDYAVVGKMTFSREKETVSIYCEHGYSSEFDYQKILDETVTTFNDYINYHTRDTVRNIVNKVINSTNPVRIIPRSQGKFIPKRNYVTLLGLQGLLQDLKPYSTTQECCMDIIPIVDTVEQRQLVARRVNAEFGTELDNLVAELAKQLNSGNQNINMDTVKRMVSRAQDIQKRVAEYEKVLNVRLSVLRSQIAEFVKRAGANVSSESKDNTVVC